MTNRLIETVYITGILDTWTSFGATASKHQGVFVPANVAKAAQIQVGGFYDAVLVPNDPDKAKDTPWFLVEIFPQGEQDEDDFADVFDALDEHDCPMEPGAIGIGVSRLERAWRKGKIVRVEAKQSPHAEPVVMWAYSMEVV